MSETRSWRVKSVAEQRAPINNIRSEPVGVGPEVFRVAPPYVVALERLWYSLKVLVVGKSVSDKKTSRDYIRRDLP